MAQSYTRWTLLCGVAALAMAAGEARAEYPGALWSVDMVEITGADPETTVRIRSGLRHASETYFFGDRAVKVEVRVTAPGEMALTVVDRLTGAPMAATGTMALTDDVAGAALTWMGTLECMSESCGPVAGGTQLAAAPPTPAPVAPSIDQTRDEAPAPQLAFAETGVTPVPAPRPQQAFQLAGLDQTRLARTPDLSNAEPVRIARFNTQGIGKMSYSDTDALVLAEPGATGSAAPTQAAGSTVVGRWLTGFARFLGFGPAPVPAASAPAAALPTATAPRDALAQPSTPLTAPFRPSERWRLTPRNEPLAQQGTQLAALSPQAALARPSAAQPAAQTPASPTFTGIRVVPSPGLSLPEPQPDRGETVVTPIRFTAVSPGVAQTAQRRRNNLSVRIDPEVFGKYSAASVGKLLGSYGNRNAKVELVADESAGGSVDRILASRGLALDSDRYARAERVFWSGNDGSRGFWIAMPQAAPSTYVLIASKEASVIANVHSNGSNVRVSDAVAKALGMEAGSWSDVQIIALKPIDRTARARTRTRLQ